MTKSSKGSTRRSAAEWQQLIEQHRDSQQTQAAFCKTQGVALATFQYWKRRLQHSSATTPIASPWLEVPLTLGSAEGGWQIELDLGGGVRLRLSRR